MFWPLLAYNIILTPFLLMVILSWVSPIMAPFDTSLDTLNFFNCLWYVQEFGKASLFVLPKNSFLQILLACTLSSDHFPLWHWSRIFRHLSCLSSYMWCATPHRCLLTILQYLLHCSLLVLLNRMCLLNRGCRSHSLYLIIHSP